MFQIFKNCYLKDDDKPAPEKIVLVAFQDGTDTLCCACKQSFFLCEQWLI